MNLVIGVLIATSMLYLWYRQRARRLSVERLAAWSDVVTIADESAAAPRSDIRVFPPRYRWLVVSIGVAAFGALWLFVGLPIPIAVAGALLIGVAAHLIEEHIGGQKTALIEAQLAAAIYLMVASLRAGASLLAAFDSALEEMGAPLRPYFQEAAGRIRLGDDPRAAVGDMQRYIPLETFRLFATSLVVHWEVGGSLATTLSTVGQTVRDRIELARRVRAQSVESHASVAVVLGIAYVLGFLMWRKIGRAHV